jgi:hypothetical protein
MRCTVGVRLLLLLLLAVSFTKASARIGVSWADDVEPRRLRSVDDLSSEVFDELLQLHLVGVGSVLQFPTTARRIHRIVVEGSAGEGEDFDHHARGRALKALNDGSDRVLAAISTREKELTRRALASGDSRELRGKTQIAGIVALAAFVIFLVVLAVTNIVLGTTGELVIPLKENNDFLTGTPGESFKKVFPCNRLPLQQTANPGEDAAPLYASLPITQGLTETIFFGTEAIIPDVVNIFKTLLDVKQTILLAEEFVEQLLGQCRNEGESCKLTSDCCKEQFFRLVNCNSTTNVCEKIEPDTSGFSVEPFCLLWSESTKVANTIDTLAFVPATRWPPIKPLVFTGSILPFCAAPKNTLSSGNECKFCEFYKGFEGKRFSVGPFIFQQTIQFGGVAISWADRSKLAFGTNGETVGQISVWDGFLDVVSLAGSVCLFVLVLFARAVARITNTATTTVSFLSIFRLSLQCLISTFGPNGRSISSQDQFMTCRENNA